MKNSKATCLIWTVLFLALAGASGWLVHRRSPTEASAFFGGLTGGILLIIVLAWLSAIPGRIYEWWLIVRAKLGSEPRDGRRAAIIGTLRGHGELLTPFSRKRCVLYSYEITGQEVASDGERSWRKAYEGFAMVPLAIEHGVERTRILAKPEIPGLDRKYPRGADAEANAKQFVANAAFVSKPSKSDESASLMHGDGRLRYDYAFEPLETDVTVCRFEETYFPPDVEVCVIGEYRADRHALVDTVTIRTGNNHGVAAAWRVVNAGIAALIFAVITVAAAVIFLLNHPLDAVEQARPEWKLTWWEIEFERDLIRRVRTPLVQYGALSTPGYRLQSLSLGRARGRLEIDERVIELKHAAYVGERTVVLSEQPGDRDGVTLVSGEGVTLTIDGKSFAVPQSWFVPSDVETALDSDGDYSGRITVVAPDRWIRCRVYFRTKVDAEDWLRK